LNDQAFLWVNDTSSFSASQGYDGLLGLGPNQSSVIKKKVDKKGTSADNFLQRTFTASASNENYITLLLDRNKDPGQNLTGQFTVSEVVSGYENVKNMPKLDVDTVNRLLKSDQHWQALTDKTVGIIGPDGQPIQVKSIVPSAPSKTYVAVIDSGFTLSQVPRDVSDAIYGRVRGAVYDTKNEWWLVPCGQYLNVSFTFGGVNYPIHPLDLVDDNFAIVDSTGKKACIGSFQPITSAFSLLGHYDMILGMSFLRNAYSLYDFGYWINVANEDEHPFMQMLSLTDPQAAQKDFVQVRLDGNSSALNDPKYSLLAVADMQHSPISDEEKKKRYQEWILSRWPYIFTGCFAFVIIVTSIVIWKCCCQRGKCRCCCKRKDGAGMDAGGIGGRGHKKGLSSGTGAFGHTKRDSYVPLETQNSRSVADLNSPSPYGKAAGAASSPRPSYAGSHRSEHNRGQYDSSYSASAADLTAPYIPPHSPRSPHSPQHFGQNYEQGNYSTNSVHSYSGYQDGHGQQQPQQYPPQYQQQQYQEQQYQQQQQQGGYYDQQQHAGYGHADGGYHAR
jgi:hypothetical protein